jgi:GNAT superfamily N-acetyltransferase
MLKLRPAERADIESLLYLLDALFTIEQDFVPDRNRQRRGLEKLLEATGAYAVVAEYEGEVVGMATIQTLISTAEGGPAGVIEDLVVSEAYRGRGIGQAIMNHLLYWAEQRGLSRLQLLADQDNRFALEFYRRQGWSTTRLIALRKNL